MRICALPVLPGLLLALAVSGVQAEPKPQSDSAETAGVTRATVAREIGFGDPELAEAAAGAILTRQRREDGARELSVALVAAVPMPVAKAVPRFEAADLEADASILDWGSIDEPPVPANFQKLTLPVAELEKLAGDDVESAFNFSPAGLALLAERKRAAATPAERKQAALAALREILLDRVKLYQTRGLEGIAPYRRDGRQVFPDRDLRAALPADDGFLARADPDFQRWLRDYPRVRSGPDPATGERPVRSSRFIWLVRVLDGRPAVVLAHRAESAGTSSRFAVQRDFYVGHGIDALQVLAGVVPAGERETVLFYTNRIYNEPPGNPAAQRIVQRVLTGQVRALFDGFVTGL